MSLIRQTYPKLNLFLNWCLHPKISESNIAYSLLLDLSLQCLDALQQKGTEEETKDATRKLVRITENLLDIPSLRQEYRRLFERFKLPLFLFNIKDNWDAFMKVIIEEIADKPLTFPEDTIGAFTVDEVPPRHRKAFETIRQIRQLAPSRPWAQVVGIQIQKGSEGFPNMYCIQLTTMSKVRYSMQLKGKEPDSAFNAG